MCLCACRVDKSKRSVYRSTLPMGRIPGSLGNVLPDIDIQWQPGLSGEKLGSCRT